MNEDEARARISELEAEVATYRHAFETTAADRDRIAELLAAYEKNYEHRYFPLPNFHCLGAPKCGTSTVYSILRNLDDIFLTPKDLNYLRDANFVASEYLDKTASDLREAGCFYSGEKIVGEFNVDAFTNPSYPSETKRVFGDDVKILFCLRNPVRRIVSEYKMRLHALRGSTRRGNLRFTEEFDLSEAISREIGSDERIQSLPYDPFKQTTMYISTSLYHAQLMKFFDMFPEENLFFLIFEEDIVQDIENSISTLLKFLEIPTGSDVSAQIREDAKKYWEISQAPDDFRVEFTLRDDATVTDAAEVGARADDIAKIEVHRVSPVDRPAIVLDEPTPRLVSAALRLPDRHRQILDLEAQCDLYRSAFADDVSRLEELLGRDLSVWYRDYL